jgi:hypothetical protein
MSPDHEVRRKLIREWMALPRDKRQTQEQAATFAKKATEANEIGHPDPYLKIMAWLSPRTGRA